MTDQLNLEIALDHFPQDLPLCKGSLAPARIKQVAHVSEQSLLSSSMCRTHHGKLVLLLAQVR